MTRIGSAGVLFSTQQAADKLKATGKFDSIKTRVIAALPHEGKRLRSGHRGIGVQLLNIHHAKWEHIKAEFPNAVNFIQEPEKKSFD